MLILRKANTSEKSRREILCGAVAAGHHQGVAESTEKSCNWVFKPSVKCGRTYI